MHPGGLCYDKGELNSELLLYSSYNVRYSLNKYMYTVIYKMGYCI